MSDTKRLTKKQLAVIDDLFDAELNEPRIFEKHKISKRTYDKWLKDEIFVREIDRKLESAKRQNNLLIARYATGAVVKLIELTNSESQETARRACLDIIGLLRPIAKPESATPEDNPDNTPELPPELAGKLLSVIAENSGKIQDIKPGASDLGSTPS